MAKLLFVALSALLLAGVGGHAQTCETFAEDSLCAAVLAYNVTAVNSNPFGCQAFAATRASSSFLAAASADVTDACGLALTQLECARAYTPCGVADAPPTTMCQAVQVECGLADLNPATNPNMYSIGILAAAQFPMIADPTDATTAYLTALADGTFCSGASTDYTLQPTPASLLPLATCEAYEGTVCSGIINYDVYISGGSSQTAVEGFLSFVQFLFSTVDRETCRDPLMRLVCGSAFPRCRYPLANAMLGQNGPPFFGGVDRTLCDEATTSCPADVLGPLFAGLAQLLPSTAVINQCDTIVPIGVSTCTPAPMDPTGGAVIVPLYPTDTATFNGIPVASNKFTDDAGAADPFDAATSISCPLPAVAPFKPGAVDVEMLSTTSCAFPCPLLIYTEDQYQRSDLITLILSIVGLVLETLLLVTYFAFKKTRKNVYTIFFTFCVWMISMVLAFAPAADVYDGPEHVDSPYVRMRCKNNAQPNHGGYCLWMAIGFTYFGFSAVCWWFVQAVDLFLQIVFRARKWSPARTKLKHALFMGFGFIYPLLIVIVVAALGEMGNSATGVSWCFILDTNLSWGFFYAPIGAMSVLGSVFMSLIMREIYLSAYGSGAHRRKGWWRIYIRPIIFVCVFLFVWGFVFAFRFSIFFNENTWQFESQELIICKLVTLPRARLDAFLSGGPAITDDPCAGLGAQPDLGVWYMIHFVIGGVGVWGFLLYNTKENLVMWYHLLTCKDYNFSKTAGDSTGSRTETGDSKTSGSRQNSRRNLKKGDSTASGDGSEAAPGAGLKYGTEMTSV